MNQPAIYLINTNPKKNGILTDMYIQVKLLRGYPQPLWYFIPPELIPSIIVGSIVHVPLRNKIVTAIVILITPDTPPVSFAIKKIDRHSALPADNYYSLFIKKLAAYFAINPITIFKRISPFIQDKSPKNHIVLEKKTDLTNDIYNKTPVTLTDEQQNITNFLKPPITNASYAPTLLHGVTASGKTEVYKELIIHTAAQKKTTVLLLPEVTLAQAFEQRLRKELAGIVPIYGFHSGSTKKEKELLWQQLLTKEPLLIIGVHLPIFLPIANLGFIIIDEEHEIGYQEKKHPKINSKDAALLRAQCTNIPILLGSATPSLSTLYNIKKKEWHFFQLKNRFKGTFPTVNVVSLADKNDRKNFWISQTLYNAIKERLIKKEQTIIFLNRRGFSFFVQCKECSFIFNCDACSVSLTLHTGNTLTCHYCGFNKNMPSQCPTCNNTDFLKKGIGTQQVVAILESLFPHARVARADMDVTVKKKEWQHTMQQFMDGHLDILVGTQTITKGYDFAHVTLVGILWADLNLHFPLYNAAETTLQQLIQVAGRAGRQSNNSLVIVQTMSDHPIFNYVNETDYLSFYETEIEKRMLLDYPPSKRLAQIELKYLHEECVEKESHAFAHTLLAHQQTNYPHITILGPAKPPLYKIKNYHIRKLYIKGTSMYDIIRLFTAINTHNYTSTITFTPHPVT